MRDIAVRSSRSRVHGLASCLAAAAVASVGGCGGTPFQVIEELEFAASLGIDLDSMELLPSGVYIEDIVVGPGNTIFPTSQVLVAYTGYLADGSSFGEGEDAFALSAGEVIPGVELGIIGMNQGGQRRIIIPPELGYGEEEQSLIPAGSVLIFDVEALEVTGGSPAN